MKKFCILSVFLFSASVFVSGTLYAQNAGDVRDDQHKPDINAVRDLSKYNRRSSVSVTVKNKETLEMAIIKACAAVGWKAQKEPRKDIIHIEFTGSDDNWKAEVSYNQEGYNALLRYIGEEREGLNRTASSSAYALSSKLAGYVKDSVRIIKEDAPRPAKKQEKSFVFKLKDKNIVENSILKVLRENGWKYKTLDNNKLVAWFEHRDRSYIVWIDFDESGYVIGAEEGMTFTWVRPEYEYSSITGNRYIRYFDKDAIDALTALINSEITVSCDMPQEFGTRTPFIHNDETLFKAIEQTCKLHQWRIVKRKDKNNITAFFWMPKGKHKVYVNIYYKAYENGCEYKITYKDSDNMAYDEKTGTIDPLYNEWVYGLDLGMYHHIKKKVRL